MPQANQPLHVALDRLAAEATVPANPERALVSRWNGTAFTWSSLDLVYMKDLGTSLVATAALASRPLSPEATTQARHRCLSLLLAHLAPSAGLVRAAPTTNSQYLREWAHRASMRLSRLYGPAPAGADYWGLETRHYLINNSLCQEIERVRGQPLYAAHPAPTSYP
jgi:hypothetical protein